MKAIIAMSILTLTVAAASAQVVTIPNVLDGQLRHTGTGLQYNDTSDLLTVQPMANYAERGFAVFPIDGLPVDYDLVTLAFDLAYGAPGVFEVLIYGSDETA